MAVEVWRTVARRGRGGPGARGGDGNSERTSNAVGVAMAPTNRLSVSQIFHTRKETESVSSFDVKSSLRRGLLLTFGKTLVRVWEALDVSAMK